jgi:protein O-mannosyl-transferase
MIAGRKAQLGQAALLVAVVLIAYSNSLQGSFQYDDFHSIVRNQALRDPGNLPTFFTDPSMFSADAGKAMYRPLLLASFTFNYWLHGYGVAGYHVVNVILHLACVVLLWRLSRRLSSTVPALAAALLFAAHPLTAEPVNYISSRSELLLGLFFLGSMWAHARAFAPAADSGSRSGIYRLLAAGFCALALLSKATAVMLPAVLLLIDALAFGWRPSRSIDLLRRHGVYWLFAAVYVGIIVANGFLGGSLATPVRGVAAQALIQVKAWSYYLRLLVVPQPLSVDHVFSDAAAVGAAVVLSAALIMSLLWLAGRHWRRLPTPVLGLVVGGLVLLPTTLMPLNVLINERRLYLVVAVLCLSLVTLVRLQRSVVLAAAVILALLTMQRNAAWATQTTLWESAHRNGSRSYRTWVNLGKAYHEAGAVEAAQRAYEIALELDDRHGDVYNNLAVLLHQSGSVREAVPWYEKARSRYPDMDEIYQNLADAHVQLKQYEQAATVYEAALAKDGDNGAVWNNLGEVRMRQRDYAGAERAFRRAVGLLPENHEPNNNLGNALDAQGASRRQEALAAYRQALPLAAGDDARAVIYANLGETLRRSRALESAAALLDSSLHLAPTATASDYRGRVAFDMGDLPAAAAFWQQATTLDPALGTAWTGLGELQLASGRLADAEQALRRAVDHGGGTRAWWSLAQCLEKQAAIVAAADAYRQLISLGRVGDPRVAAAEQRLQALGQTERQTQ